MKFGVREICEVVLKAKATQRLGNRTFYKGEPVLYFDTLKTSSLEGAATTVYAQGGRGNSRLIAWEGERTVTFTMEDALISPLGFSILSGAGLVDATATNKMYQHMTSQVVVGAESVITLPVAAALTTDNAAAEIFVMKIDAFGETVGEPCIPATTPVIVVTKPTADKEGSTVFSCFGHTESPIVAGDVVIVDYYVEKTSGLQQIEITADKFGGNYYLEASTLFRRTDGVDMPAEFVIPNGKIQSNFTFAMASTGDPSTFTFVMDAFPDYTKFDQTHKVIAAIQVIEENVAGDTGKREPCEKGGAAVVKAQGYSIPKSGLGE